MRRKHYLVEVVEGGNVVRRWRSFHLSDEDKFIIALYRASGNEVRVIKTDSEGEK